MAKVWKYLILLIFHSSVTTFGQANSKYSVGLNFVTLYAGTPELQLEYFPLKSLGGSVNYGYVYEPRRGGFILVGDDAEILELKGHFLKIGLKYRTTPKEGHSLIWFGQLSYIYSKYTESGKHNASVTGDPIVNYAGFVNGVAVSIGLECRIFRPIYFRTGFQIGAYGKRNHLGYPGHTYQPGLGASGQILNDQIFVAFVYKFDRIRNVKEQKVVN